jgi:phosphate-selective porin OprO/OprP
LALSQERPDDDRLSFSARPETRLRDLRVARSGTLNDADSLRRIALEGLTIQGSVYLQGEWLLANAARSERPDFDAAGWYVQGGWLSGGAMRGYRNGVIQGTDRGGVLELGARVAQIDLNDGAVRGGRARSLAAVASWYFTPDVRAMLGYSRANILDGGQKGDVSTLELRLQYVF